MGIPIAQMPDWRAWKEAESGDFFGSFLKGATSGALRAAKLRREMGESEREFKLKTGKQKLENEKFKAGERESLYKHGMEKKELAMNEKYKDELGKYYNAIAEDKKFQQKLDEKKFALKEHTDKWAEQVSRGSLGVSKMNAQARMLGQQLKPLIAQAKAVATKRKKIAANLIDLFSAKEYKKQMFEWNDNQKEGPKPNMTEIKAMFKMKLETTLTNRAKRLPHETESEHAARVKRVEGGTREREQGFGMIPRVAGGEISSGEETAEPTEHQMRAIEFYKAKFPNGEIPADKMQTIMAMSDDELIQKGF